MAKFNEQEKEQIRQCLLTKGKELFTHYGLAKTSIDDLVQACGIAKGSFYKFFSSKEELFYVILQNQEEITNQLLAGHLQKDLPPKELISSFLHLAYKLADENPLLQQWFQEGEAERILRKVPKHLIKDYSKDNIKKGIAFVQALMEKGIFRKQDPEVINGVLHAILRLRVHKEEIGEDIFPKVMNVIIDCIAAGLTTGSK